MMHYVPAQKIPQEKELHSNITQAEASTGIKISTVEKSNRIKMVDQKISSAPIIHL